ncbi:MAG: chemotaxis protein CheW [Leptospirales bacterium]|jgi:purine-binding chemotaxis protein CheW
MQHSESPGEHLSCLLFELAGARYAVSVGRVFEILWLPELTPLAQSPFDVPGIFNLRGRIVTVIDLNLRLGYKAARYQTSNRVIVMADDDNLTGIIVDAVREVRGLEADQMSDPPEYGLEAGERASLYISHVARLGDELITLLDEDRLLHYSQGLHERILEVNASVRENGEMQTVPSRDIPVFCPEALPPEREIFQKRAKALLQSSANQEHSASEILQVAILSLGKELFAIELDVVVEFTDVKSPTLVPCTPEHIVGCMNLRGEILTIIDIRGILNLGLSARNRGSKLVIARIADIIVGVVVDDILDILSVPAESLQELPSSAGAGPERKFMRGAIAYDGRFAPLMDLTDVILKGGIVNDARGVGS